MAKASDQPAAPAAALPGHWSRPLPLSGSGAVGSPGGTHPLVAGAGGVHVVWETGGSIHYRHSSDAGASWARAARLTTGGTAVYPCSLELAGSALHLIWPDKRHAGQDRNLHVRRGRDREGDAYVVSGLDGPRRLAERHRRDRLPPGRCHHGAKRRRPHQARDLSTADPCGHLPPSFACTGRPTPPCRCNGP